MREPAFWWQRGAAMGSVLAPLGWIYGAVSRARMKRAGVRALVPVICVGNYHVGGAGKTPLAIALAEKLIASGERVAFLTRGYGGSFEGPVEVDAGHTARDVGDEPLLLARAAPVIVSRARALGAQMAQRLGASVIVMDDGFQNPSLNKDLSIIVMDGMRGLGNGQVFPAGPLRAPLDVQLARTDALVLVGEGAGASEARELAATHGIACFMAHLEPDAAALARLSAKRIFAFAGIGDPHRFFRMLAAQGCTIEAHRAFADHHDFTRDQLVQLIDEAKARGLQLVTTEKDMVRIASQAALRDLAAAVDVLPVKMMIEDAPRWENWLAARLAQAHQQAGATMASGQPGL